MAGPIAPNMLGNKRLLDSIESGSPPPKRHRSSVWVEPPEPPPAFPIDMPDATKYLNRDNNKRLYTSTYSNVACTRSNLRLADPVPGLGDMLVFNTERDAGLGTSDALDLFDRIEDHAYRRVQLFYFLCLAYWKEQVTVDRDTTCIQHGIGPYYGTHAAHSSILPSIKDNWWEHLNVVIANKGVTRAVGARLLALGMTQQELLNLRVRSVSLNLERDDAIDIREYFPELGHERYVCKDSAFFQSLNSTIILPSSVNMYDCCIEKVIRDEAITLLNQCSRGQITPYQASEALVEGIQNFLNESEAEVRQKIERLDEMYLLEQTIASVEVEVRHVDLDDPKACLKALKRHLCTMHRFNRVVTQLTQPGKSVSIKASLTKRHKPLTSAMKVIGAYLKVSLPDLGRQVAEVLPKQPQVVKRMLTELKAEINKRGWFPYPLGWVRSNVEEVLSTIEAQRQGTSLPAMELLSGVKDGDGRREMNADELFYQKMQIIRRVPVLHYEDEDFGKESVFPDKKKN